MTNITRVKLAADSSEIRKGARDLDTMQRSGKRAEGAVDKLGRRLLGLAAGVATVEGLRRATIGATTAALSMGEAVNDLADQTGVAGTTIQGLRQQADQMGASAQDVNGGLRRFNRRLGLAAEGSGAAASAVKLLGMNLETADGQMRGTEDVLRDVMDRLSELDSEARRSAVASEFFGEEAGPALAKALSQGSGALDETIRQLRDTGRLLEDDVAENAARASANLRDLQRGASQAFQVGVLEGFGDGLDDIERSSREINDILGGLGEGIGDSMRRASEAIEPVATQVGRLVDALDTIRPILQTESFALSPLGLAAGSGDSAPTATSGTIRRPGGEGGGGSGGAVEPAAAPQELELLREKNRLLEQGVGIKEADRQVEQMRVAQQLRSQDATEVQIAEYLHLQQSIARVTAEAERLQALENRVAEIQRQADPAGAAMRELENQTTDLADAWESGLIDIDQFYELTGALQEAAEEAGNVGDEVERAGGGIDDMTRNGRDALRSMQQMFDQGEAGYKNLEVAIQAMNFAQAASAVLNQGSGDPYTAFARMAAMASAVASLGYAVGSLGGGGGGSTDPTERRQGEQGTGTVLGDSDAKSESIAASTEITANATRELVGINRSMLDALQRTEQGIESVALQTVREFGGIGSITSGEEVFSSTDVGIQIEGGRLRELMQGATVEAFESWQAEALGDVVGSGTAITEDLSDTVGEQVGQVFTSMADSVASGAEALGMSADEVRDRIENFQVATEQLSLEGLTGEEQREELAAYFGAQFDDLVGEVVPYIEEFQRIGEGLGETLTRVGTAVQVSEEGARRLGFELDATGKGLAEASVELTELAGGVESFIDQMAGFVGNFAPEAEKFRMAADDMERALGRVGLEVPDTRDEMWELMDSLDASTESGREQIAALLEASDVADDYYSMVEQREKEQAQRRQEALDAATGQVESFAQSLEREAQQIGQAADRLRGRSEAERQAARDTLRDALSTGELSGTGRAAGVAADLRPEDFATRAEYEAERDRTIWLIDQLEKEADEQISAAERTVDELEKLNGSVGDMVDLLEGLASVSGFNPETGEIPGYANGGTHTGGLRVVGERGPELEATGPSAVAANDQLQAALSANAELLAEVRNLQAYLRQGNKNTGRMADRVDRWYRESVTAETLEVVTT